MKKILIASANPGKIAELKAGLKYLEKEAICLLTLNDVKVGDKKPVENGKTFQKNSLIKAKFYANLTHLPCLSDDGGLVIPYLDNEPGVRSRRWLGHEATDQELIDYTLTRLDGVKGNDRSAYLKVTLCFYNPKTNKEIFESEKISGHISEVPTKKRIMGFPYRALLIVNKYNKFYDELTVAEHQMVNHRLIALKRLTKKIVDLI